MRRELAVRGGPGYIAMDSIDYGSKIDTEEVLDYADIWTRWPCGETTLGEYGIDLRIGVPLVQQIYMI